MSSTVTEWAAQLKRPDRAARLAAANALREVGEAASAAAVALVHAVADDDESVRNQVVAALENLPSPPANAVNPLAELLRDHQGDRSYWAATLLGRAGVAAKSAVPALADCLASPTNPLAVREKAAWALGKIGAAAAPARSTLEAATREDAPRLARLAAEALTKL